MNITVDVSAPIEDLDFETAVRLIEKANRGRETPLPLATTAEKKASLETVIAERLEKEWVNEIKRTGAALAQAADIRVKFRDATPAQRAAAIEALEA